MIGKKRKQYTIKDHSNPRDIALCVLLEICENERKSNILLKETFEAEAAAGHALTRTDRAFIGRIVIGTLDRLITLDTVISRFTSRPVRAQKPLIRGILRMSLYQMMYMDRVPLSAACNEGVKLAGLHGMEGMSGFVNGVLRSAARDIEAGGEKTSVFHDVSEKYSLPGWICRLLESEYGSERAEAMFAAFLEDRPETLRLNLSAIPDAENVICGSLASEGYELVRIDMQAILEECGAPAPGGRLPVMYELASGGDIAASTAFRRGWVTVQDPASALTASYADPGEDSFVLDVCAAPGGKSIAAADLTGGHGHIEARDINARRTALIEENVRRCGFDNISIRVLDALTEDEDSFYRADVLLADLPCTGLGVIAKKPDIKLSLQPYSVEELQILQRDILANVSRFVKPKGRLVYSTCTLTAAENEDNVAWMEQYLGLKAEQTVRLLPGRNHDGFFIAVMRKRY